MCYDIKASLESQLRRAEFLSDEKMITELKEKLRPFLEENTYHASGYTHPYSIIYPNNAPKSPTLSIWGLIPEWIKNSQQQVKFWNNTLNARGETIFEKPSFKASALNKRCIIILEGFYEHHHLKGKIYPHLIQHKSGEPLAVAGLWSEWLNKDTGELVNSFTIVTTKANKLLAQIHNNPKLKEPRMPVILQGDEIEQWLAPISNEKDLKEIHSLVKPYPDDLLNAYTVRRLRGIESVGNTPEATEEFNYPELSQSELF